MPRMVSEFRIVVASPSDVYEERDIALDVIQELNRVFEGQGVSLKGLGWEEYAAPGIGAEPQDVVNSQIMREFDMLIAVFWKSLGTPTERHPSGTAEEIERAIANESSVLGQHRVQVYFKDQLDSIAGAQLSELMRVEKYRNDLSSRGCFYRLFKSSSEFRGEVRVNIQRPIMEFLRGRVSAATATENPAKTAISSAAGVSGEKPIDARVSVCGDDPPSALEYMAEAEEGMADAMASVDRMAQLIGEIGVEAHGQAEKMERLLFPGVSAREKKEVINSFASFLVAKAGLLKTEAVAAQRDIAKFSGAMVLAIASEKEQVDSQAYENTITALLAEAEKILRSAVDSRTELLKFRLSIESLPRITTQFNQAKRILLDAVEECVGLANEMERSIYEITAQA